MVKSLLLLAFSEAATVTAQTSITVWLPGYTGLSDSVEASVVDAKDSATTLALNCDGDSPECFLIKEQTITWASSTLDYTFRYDAKEMVSIDAFNLDQTASCDIDVKKSIAQCQVLLTGTVNGEPTGGVMNFVTMLEPEEEVHVTITDGAKKLGQEESETTVSGRATSTTETRETEAAASTGSSSQETISGTDNGASAATQPAYLAGFAAVLGGAAMLV
ncbi:hypothetical protein ACJ41O_003346 [Fusarium nematophilum]